MNRQSIRIAAGANLVAGCLLLQGCGTFGKKPAEQPAATVPEVTNEVVTTEPTPVEMPVELPPVQSSTSYTVQKGDTISAIAYRFGIRWQDVVAVNPGIEPRKLRVGQTIQLPGQVDVAKARHVTAPAPKAKVSAPKTKVAASKSSVAVSGPVTMYVVKSGDSLSLIAHKHGVKVAAVREANGLKSDRIVVGQKLKIPGATKKVSEPKTASAPKTTAPKAKAVAETKKPAAVAAPTPPPAVESAPAAVPAPAAAEPAPAAAAPAAAAPAPAADANTQTYTVKEGEDLYAVAIRWGVSPSDLKALNNLTSTELKAGTVLKIPSAQ